MVTKNVMEGRNLLQDDVLRVLVEHNGQELIYWKHFAQRFGLQQFPSTLKRKCVSQSPVGVIRVYQVFYPLHPAFRILHLQPLTAHVSGREGES